MGKKQGKSAKTLIGEAGVQTFDEQQKNFRPGNRIPSERALLEAAQAKAERENITVRKAMRLLKEAQLARKRDPRGADPN